MKQHFDFFTKTVCIFGNGNRFFSLPGVPNINLLSFVFVEYGDNAFFYKNLKKSLLLFLKESPVLKAPLVMEIPPLQVS